MEQISSHRLVENATRTVGYFLSAKGSAAQLALYRGFLHEVNNALAGIGSLAEVLKDADNPVLGSNLDLMAKAANKATVLQRRIRMLYTEGEAWEMDLVEFIRENKDLMELMLPRSQRLAVEVAMVSCIVKISVADLWRMISLMLLWAREGEAEGISLKLSDKTLLLELLEDKKTHVDAMWTECLSLAAKTLGVEGGVGDKRVVLKF